MKTINFKGENIEFYYCSWKELGDLTEKLSFKILDKGLEFDRIVALATGGLTTSRSLKDYLKVKKLSVMQVEFYKGIDERAEFPIITQSVPVSVEGEKILVFDDINDTGKTLKTAVAYLKLRGAKAIYTATIFQKPHTTFPSNFYVKEIKAWVIFPDEVRETIELLTKRWKGKLSKSEIVNRLKKIGFKEDQIKRFSF